MMRSYEDRWNWLRAQLEDDRSTLADMIARAESEGSERTAAYRNRHAQTRRTLGLMDDADRNGPVEPL